MKVTVTCPGCGETFQRYRSQVRTNNFCNDSCLRQWRADRFPGTPREKLLARKKREREKNKERYRAYAKKYWAENKEKLSEDNREWVRSNPSKSAAYTKKWARSNPERFNASVAAKHCNQRARRFNSEGRISLQDVLELWERESSCIWCGEGRGVDHVIDFRFGGLNVPENLQNLCQSCNSLKAAKIDFSTACRMRELHKNGMTTSQLSDMFGITPSNVWCAITGKSWSEDAWKHELHEPPSDMRGTRGQGFQPRPTLPDFGT